MLVNRFCIEKCESARNMPLIIKSDIAPVINIGGTAIHTRHDVVWAHEIMDMPESDKIIEVNEIREMELTPKGRLPIFISFCRMEPVLYR